MEPTAEQKAAFGQALAEARKAAGLSGPAVAGALTDRGFPTSHQAYYKWEKGDTAPEQREALDALADLLDAPHLPPLLLGGADVGAELAELRQRISELEAQIAALVRRRR